jgi:thiol-disulfide isomerase/thioredoxin
MGALLAGLVLLVAGEAVAADLPGGAVAAALRGRTLTAIDGSTLPAGSLAGQVVVVNFWATWCKPCRREMPRLVALDRELSRRGGRVIAVSIDEDPENVRRFAKSLGLELPLYVDGPKGLVRTLDLERIPTTFVLDRDGTMVHRSEGSTDADLDRLAAVTRRLTGGTATAGGGAE